MASGQVSGGRFHSGVRFQGSDFRCQELGDRVLTAFGKDELVSGIGE